MPKLIFIIIVSVSLTFADTSAFSKDKDSKQSSRYLYKAEAGAYIEASRKETFSVCPDKGIKGAWVSEYSVSIDNDNCLSVQTPSLAGTFRILFLGNSGRADTIQVLVEQSYIQMGDYSHQIWVPDSMPSRCYGSVTCEFPAYGHYENKKYSQSLIVDKTKLTMGDAQYYSKISDIEFTRFQLKEYPKNESLEESKLPYTQSGSGFGLSWKFANERSKREGLDTAYQIISKFSYNNIGGKFVFLGSYDKNHLFAIDTSVSGYRLPCDEEWLFLMRAGASTRYYWGDEEDSATVSRYAWFCPTEFKSVAQLFPNGFGLYDMAGLTNAEFVEVRSIYDYDAINNVFIKKTFNDFGHSCGSNKLSLSPECDFIENRITALKQYMGKPSTVKRCITEPGKPQECANYNKPVLKTVKAGYYGFRLLRKTPKLQKLEKF